MRALLLAAAFCLAAASPALAQGEQITRAKLDEMFVSIKAQTAWDMSHNMLWGYYFLNDKKPALEKAAKTFAARGYRVVDVAETEPGKWQLHIEMVETHSPATLDARNQEFYKFAAAAGLDAYDGMDVGPAPPGAN